jgi:chromate transporter
VWTSAIEGSPEFALDLTAFALVFWKVPPWLVVILSAVAGWGLQQFARCDPEAVNR